MYARTIDGQTTIGTPPRLHYDGERWWDLRDATDEQTYDWSIELVDGLPVETWTPRPWTADELAAQAAAAQYEADRLTVRQIVTDLKAEKARAQAVIDTPNATIKSNPAPYVVDVARAAKRIADAAIDLARYVAPDGQ